MQPTFPDGCLLVMNGEGARLVGWLVVGAALTNEATQNGWAWSLLSGALIPRIDPTLCSRI